MCYSPCSAPPPFRHPESVPRTPRTPRQTFHTWACTFPQPVACDPPVRRPRRRSCVRDRSIGRSNVSHHARSLSRSLCFPRRVEVAHGSPVSLGVVSIASRRYHTHIFVTRRPSNYAAMAQGVPKAFGVLTPRCARQTATLDGSTTRRIDDPTTSIERKRLRPCARTRRTRHRSSRRYRRSETNSRIASRPRASHARGEGLD